MKKIIALLILSGFTAVSCNQSDKSSDKEMEQKKDTVIKTDTVVQTDQTNQVTGAELDYLRKYAGKYPMDVKLLEDPKLSPRLEKILGDRFMFVMETWAVEAPIEIRGDKFIASACQAHNCGNTNFIILADISTNKISVGVREEGKTKTYTEATTVDPVIEEWVKGN